MSEELKEGNVCAEPFCRKDLRKLKEIHVVEGMHYCSKSCAIVHQAQIIIASAQDTATQWYADCAEVVTPQDIGILYERKWTAYSADTDTTTIFVSKCLDKECEEVVSVEVVGFYFGEPDDASTETYTGALKAVY